MMTLFYRDKLYLQDITRFFYRDKLYLQDITRALLSLLHMFSFFSL